MSAGEPPRHPPMEILLRRLRYRLAASGMTQIQVSARCDFTAGYLSLLLSGSQDLKMEHLLAILEALEMPPGEFFADLSWAYGTSRPAVLIPSAEEALARAVAIEVADELRPDVEATAVARVVRRPRHREPRV